MISSSTARNWWNNEAAADQRYATLAWGGDGTMDTVAPTIDAILTNLSTFVMEDSTVAEIGCGPGRLLHRLARQHPSSQFCGFDISEDMMSLGVDDRPSNVMTKLVAGDGTIDADNFDLIYSVEVFQHLETALKEKYLRTVGSMLKPNGIAVIQYVTGAEADGWMAHPETEATMNKMARAAGLKVKKSKVPFQVHDEWRWMVMSL